MKDINFSKEEIENILEELNFPDIPVNYINPRLANIEDGFSELEDAILHSSMRRITMMLWFKIKFAQETDPNHKKYNGFERFLRTHLLQFALGNEEANFILAKTRELSQILESKRSGTPVMTRGQQVKEEKKLQAILTKMRQEKEEQEKAERTRNLMSN